MSKIILIISALVCVSCACLITNCPRGGKRGENPLLSLHSLAAECPSCGPGHQGQCFGPNICCGTAIGCFIGTPETYKCRTESLYSRPCIAGFAMCRDNTGRCAANGICCSQENCHVDSSCRISDEFNDRKIGQEYSRLSPENEQ
ncbi:neurophysin 1 [Diachasma alloeum]|uniref:neurophysin 1 n=1 Tax=Diachasma alloeum TaxID=454923 RepID=UPI0007382034|nr:neurophysin 1 [Diachasma alloeum]